MTLGIRKFVVLCGRLHLPGSQYPGACSLVERKERDLVGGLAVIGVPDWRNDRGHCRFVDTAGTGGAIRQTWLGTGKSMSDL